jgi:hypothetical protein
MAPPCLLPCPRLTWSRPALSFGAARVDGALLVAQAELTAPFSPVQPESTVSCRRPSRRTLFPGAARVDGALSLGAARNDSAPFRVAARAGYFLFVFQPKLTAPLSGRSPSRRRLSFVMQPKSTASSLHGAVRVDAAPFVALPDRRRFFHYRARWGWRRCSHEDRVADEDDDG